jgi:hypothetical protein
LGGGRGQSARQSQPARNVTRRRRLIAQLWFAPRQPARADGQPGFGYGDAWWRHFRPHNAGDRRSLRIVRDDTAHHHPAVPGQHVLLPAVEQTVNRLAKGDPSRFEANALKRLTELADCRGPDRRRPGPLSRTKITEQFQCLVPDLRGVPFVRRFTLRSSHAATQSATHSR